VEGAENGKWKMAVGVGMGMGMGVRALLHLLLLPLIKFPFKQQRNLQREVIALIIAHE